MLVGQRYFKRIKSLAQCKVLIPECLFQIGSFDSCEDIANSTVIDDKIYAIRKHGEFGEIKIDENGGYSFISISNSELKMEVEYAGRHFLFLK